MRSNIKNQYVYNNFIIFTLLLLPAFLSTLWHLNNSQLPITDAIDYLWPALTIYEDLSRFRLYETMHGLYFERGWRPTIFHIFYLPFLLISNGNLLFAIGCVHTFFTFISTYFLYKIFNEKINKILSSLCASLIAITSTVMFGGSTIPGFTEVAFISVFIGIIFFLSTSNGYFSKRQSLIFSILIFLLFSIRPVEALIYLTLPVIVFFYAAHKSEKISFYTILYILWFISSCVIILFSFSFFNEIKIHFENLKLLPAYELFSQIFVFLIFFNIILFIILQFISNKFIADSYYLKRSLILGSTLTTIWWLPSFTGLYEWVYRTSLGDVVSNMVRIEQKFITHLDVLISSFGAFTFYATLFLFFTGVLYSILLKKTKLRQIISKYELIIISSIPIPLLFYFITVQTSFRKISLAMLIITIFLAIIGIKSLRSVKYLNYLIFISLIVLVHFHGKLILEKKEYSFFKNDSPSFFVGTTFPVPINIIPNPHNTVIDKIDSLRKKYQIQTLALPIDENSNPVDPFLLSIMAKQSDFAASYPYSASFEYNLELLKNYDAALIINPEGKMIKSLSESEKYKNLMRSNQIFNKVNESRTLSANQRYTYFIQYLFAKDSLEEYGWKDVECFKINDRFEGCLIIKLKNSN